MARDASGGERLCLPWTREIPISGLTLKNATTVLSLTPSHQCNEGAERGGSPRAQPKEGAKLAFSGIRPKCYAT